MNDTVQLYSKTSIKLADGTIKNTWALVDTIVADVQPAQLTIAQLQAWGISTLQSDAKKMYLIGPVNANIKIGARATVVGDGTFDIRAANIWPSHQSAYLVPVQGT